MLDLMLIQRGGNDHKIQFQQRYKPPNVDTSTRDRPKKCLKFITSLK